MAKKKSYGFTLIELLISMGIFLTLLGLTTINFSGVQRSTSITSTIETLLSDLSQQQIKAMVGDTEGRGALDTYGIHFNASSYVLFHGTYSAADATNFTVTVPAAQQFSTTLPSSEITFQKASGNFINYAASQNSVTITDTVSGGQKIIKFNRLGIVTGIN